MQGSNIQEEEKIMPVTKVGLNLTNIQNLTAPTFDFQNTTEAFINDIPVKANEITNGWLGLITMSALFSFLYWKLSQNSIYGGDFSYSSIRAMGLSSAIASIIGLYCINLGYFTNYYHVVIFIVITFIAVGVVWRKSQ